MSIVDFVERRLLDTVAYGSEFGHRYKTRTVELKSGVKCRNAQWQQPLGRFALIYENLLQEDVALVVNAHHACMGSLVGFRMRNPFDFNAESEVIGFGTGVEQVLQLKKTYSFETLSNYRDVKKPVEGTVEVFADGASIPFSVNYTNGLVTFTAPSGAEITWSGEFDIPVQFADDDMSWPVDDYSKKHGQYISSNDVELLEIRL